MSDKPDQTVQEQCFELKHGHQRLFEPIQLMEKDMLQSIPSTVFDFINQLLGINLQINQTPNKISIKNGDLPTTVCTLIPYSPHSNIIRIVAHTDDNNQVSPSELIISSDPIDLTTTANNINSCSDYCNDKSDDSCYCIKPEELTSSFDINNGNNRGYQSTFIYVSDSISGGKKYITSLKGDIGIEVLNMFSNIINHGIQNQNRINNLIIMPSKTQNSDLMSIGGVSTKNILLNDLNINNNGLISKVNLIVKSNKDESDANLLGTEGVNIQITVTPLTSMISIDNIQECNIDKLNTEQCELHLLNDHDYNINIKNIGSVKADIDIFTVELPSNNNDMIPPPKPCPYAMKHKPSDILPPQPEQITDIDDLLQPIYFFDASANQPLKEPINDMPQLPLIPDNVMHHEHGYHHGHREINKPIGVSVYTPHIVIGVCAFTLFSLLFFFIAIRKSRARRRNLARYHSARGDYVEFESDDVGGSPQNKDQAINTNYIQFGDDNDDDLPNPRPIDSALSYEVFSRPDDNLPVAI